MPPESEPPADLPLLTILRWPAAFFVFTEHIPAASQILPHRLVGLGFVGVQFFFILSGFVLTWVHHDRGHARAFYLRRFARIYPTYFLVLAVCAVLLVRGGHALNGL